MAIEDRNLAAGMKFAAIYKGQRHECTFDGEAFIYDGQPYPSLSKAGSVVAGGTSVNGWRFWTPDGELVTKEPREKAERSGRVADRVKSIRFIRRMDNQTGVADGFVKYWCSSCMDSFTIAKGEKHDVCPRGHLERYEHDDFSNMPADLASVAAKEE